MTTVSAVGRVLLIFSVLTLCAARADAQVLGVPALEDIKSQAELDKAITALDAALFDAYNRCDLEKFASFFTDDVEFYHDQGGVTLGKVKLTESIQKNICGGDVRRELVPGTLEAHQMKGYGAVEIGVHRFYHPKTNGAAGEAKFVHLWQYISTGKGEGAWKITRVLSFDHHTAAK